MKKETFLLWKPNTLGLQERRRYSYVGLPNKEYKNELHVVFILDEKMILYIIEIPFLYIYFF